MKHRSPDVRPALGTRVLNTGRVAPVVSGSVVSGSVVSGSVVSGSVVSGSVVSGSVVSGSVVSGSGVSGSVVGVLVAVLLGAAPAQARRAPGPGGTAIVSVPAELVGAVIEAHIFAPLLQPGGLDSGAAAGDRPPLAGAPAWSSAVLARVAVDPTGKHWTLTALAPVGVVKEAVAQCLAGRADRPPQSAWPAMALRAAGVREVVDSVGNEVVVSFDQPVFVLPELLAFCPLRAAQNGPTGAYAPSGPARLAWRSGSFDAPPLLGAIEVRAPTGTESANDKADVVVNPSAAADSGTGATQLSPWPDVVVLVQSQPSRDDDPFGLRDARAGTRAFRNALRADLLAAAWASGRGGPTEALLPPGVAPARPLPASMGVDRTPLALRPVPADAPRVSLVLEGGDLLTDGVAERLAVILRARGRLLDVRRSTRAPDDVDTGSELVRWHPPTKDASLALLSFIGARPELQADPAVLRALGGGGLLAADPALRLAAALALERALLDSRRVVPLLVVDRFLVVDPDLRGVVIRADGVPLLDGAWWWGGGR